MSSQLMSVGSVGAAVGAQASPGSGGPKTLMDVFAALLGRVSGEGASTADTEVTQSSTAAFELKGAAQDILAMLIQGKGKAPVAGQEPAPEADGNGGLAGLADLLLEIEAALDAGEPVDPELLKKLGLASDALAGLIGGQVEIEPAVMAGTDVGIDVAADARPSGPEGAPEGGEDPIHPMLRSLADRLSALGDKLADVDGDLAQKLAGLAERLSTVRTTIADLINDAPELKTLIGDLMQLKVEARAEAAGISPALAAPALRLPENASLSAKTVVEPAPEPAVPHSEETPSADGDVADAPKVHVKAEIAAKSELPLTALAGKHESATQSQQPAPAVPDTTAAAVAAQSTDNGALRAVHTAYQAPSPINLPAMAFEIARQVQQGVSKFQIRLDPPELGRIDVSLDMDHSGQVNAKLTVERSETLDLLQRDQRALERALAQAGLDASKTNLEFSLKQNPFAGHDGKGQQTGGSPSGGDARRPVAAEAEPAPSTTLYRGTASPGGVNIFV